MAFQDTGRLVRRDTARTLSLGQEGRDCRRALQAVQVDQAGMESQVHTQDTVAQEPVVEWGVLEDTAAGVRNMRAWGFPTAGPVGTCEEEVQKPEA